ncbi:MAG: DivIVA domain-containing protein [Clostridia bacterium]|nr:DivIVA domain-containing protein [Clostridia bacterium]
MLESSKVKNIQFKKSKMGYDQTEVDDFLDEIEQDILDAESQISALNEKVKGLEAENNNIKISQSSIQSVLVCAQKLADEIVEKARVEAQGIIDAAKEDAAATQHESETRRIAAEQAIKQLLADAVKKSEGMINAAHDSVARQQRLFDDIKRQIANFKNDMLAKYKQHVELLAQMPDAVLVNATEAADNVINATEQEAQEKPQDVPETETKQETDDSNNQEDNSNSADSKQNGFTVNVQAYDDDDDADQTPLSSEEDDPVENEEIDFGKSDFFNLNK